MLEMGGNMPYVSHNKLAFRHHLIYRILDNGRGFNSTLLMEKARYTLTEYGFFTAENAVHIIGCAVAITMLRYALNFVIFKVWHSKLAHLHLE